MNITEQFGFGVAIMVYKHPLKQALRDLHAAIDRWDAPLAKLAGLTGELQKLLSGDLRKDAIGYTEESNRICKAAIAELEGLNDVLREAKAAMARMEKALPSYARWVFNGVKDPAGFDEPPPPRDPLMPLRDYGHFSLTEKYIAERGGPDAKLSKLAMPQQTHQTKVDPGAAVDAYLHHNPKRGAD